MISAERKALSTAYETLIKEIIDSKLYKEYANSEIDGFDKMLLEQFRQM